MKHAYGYLRKSRSFVDRSEVSSEVQEAQIRELASRWGDAEISLLSDWNRSGRGSQTRFREGYLELLRRIEDDEVSAVYGYNLRRLGRNVQDILDLAKKCDEHGVPIRTRMEGDLDSSTPYGRLYVIILAAVSQMEAELAQEQARDAVVARRARGDLVGSAGYGYRLAGPDRVERDDEDVAAVVSAFDEAKTFNGAARKLNAAGVKTRKRGAIWRAHVVRDVIAREAPERLPPRGVRGESRGSKFMFARLLRCHCGHFMSPSSNEGARYRGYACPKGHADASHPRPYYTSELKVLPWVKEELRHWSAPVTVVDGDGALSALQTTEMAGRRERVIDNYEDGLITKAQRDERLAAIADQVEQLDAAAQLSGQTAFIRWAPTVTSAPVVERGWGSAEGGDEVSSVEPVVDWEQAPEVINATLRSLWRYVELGADMRPVRAEWVNSGWRVEQHAAYASGVG
jgi:DNA invertase Pin-like site-specific DNA recombinase